MIKNHWCDKLERGKLVEFLLARCRPDCQEEARAYCEGLTWEKLVDECCWVSFLELTRQKERVCQKEKV